MDVCVDNVNAVDAPKRENALAASSVDLSSYDGSAGPTAAQVTFGTTGPFPSLAASVPEPSTMYLMPFMVIGLLIARTPAVRSFLRGF